jgi:glycosyltransferase involved in cell wall biosynthesis
MPLKTVGKVLVDFIDSPSLVRKRWKNEVFRFDFLERYELWKTIRWEGEVIRRIDETIYISDVDSQTVPDAFTPGKRRNVVPNGVDFGSYTSGTIEGIVSPSIGFLGNMSYHPNVEATNWLFEEVFLPLKERVPGRSLVIIGRDPEESILKLRKCPGVTVTGTVENIWPYVNSVDLFLFPLWTGAGLKNKILESMFAGRPVITTSIGNEGINAVSGRDILVCHDPADFQEEILRLLNSPEDRRRMGDHARDFVRHGFSWPPILKAYEEIVTGNVSPGRP